MIFMRFTSLLRHSYVSLEFYRIRRFFCKMQYNGNSGTVLNSRTVYIDRYHSLLVTSFVFVLIFQLHCAVTFKNDSQIRQVSYNFLNEHRTVDIIPSIIMRNIPRPYPLHFSVYDGREEC